MISFSKLLKKRILKPYKKTFNITKCRDFHYTSGGKTVVTVLPGDGIGPEVTASAIGIMQAVGAPVEFERFDNFDEKSQEVFTSIARNKVLLKGTLYTPHSEGPKSRNMLIRKSFEQLVDVVPIKSLPNVITRHKDIDMIVIREQVEGEYTGLEHESVPGIVQSLKITTSHQTEKVAKFAFEFAREHGRKKITIIHKANIMKLTDGLFLETVRKVGKDYPDIILNDHIIDNACMQIVANPEQYDILVTPNLYGNIVINVAAGICGGPGIIPGSNFGPRVAIFEPGTRHVGLDIGGQNKANPTAMILSSCLMLEHIGLSQYAEKISKALREVYTDTNIRTFDLGGTATTKEFTYEVIKRIRI